MKKILILIILLLVITNISFGKEIKRIRLSIPLALLQTTIFRNP